jgi:hypothetical protein
MWSDDVGEILIAVFAGMAENIDGIILSKLTIKEDASAIH